MYIVWHSHTLCNEKKGLGKLVSTTCSTHKNIAAQSSCSTIYNYAPSCTSVTVCMHATLEMIRVDDELKDK